MSGYSVGWRRRISISSATKLRNQHSLRNNCIQLIASYDMHFLKIPSAAVLHTQIIDRTVLNHSERFPNNAFRLMLYISKIFHNSSAVLRHTHSSSTDYIRKFLLVDQCRTWTASFILFYLLNRIIIENMKMIWQYKFCLFFK